MNCVRKDGFFRRIKKYVYNSHTAYYVHKKKNIYKNKECLKKLENELTELKDEFSRSGINLLMAITPARGEFRNLSAKQKNRMDYWTFDFTNITEEDAITLRDVFGTDTSLDYIVSIYKGVRVYDDNGVRRLADYKSQYVNIINGERHTVRQPCDYASSIYIFGSCTARGTGCEDKDTIESHLQSIINETGSAYRVVNKGIGCGFYFEDDLAHINETTLQTGDSVIVIEPFEAWQVKAIKNAKIPCISLSCAFQKNGDVVEWFTDSPVHTNANGNRIIAEYVWDCISELGFLQEKTVEQKTVRKGIIRERRKPEGLDEYLNCILPYNNNNNGRNGAIVMNCNPFTLGHRHLIEYASKKVDLLYVFVVQEDKSFFSFEDRYMLVKDGTKDIDNVMVIPSGRYVLSSLTFPGYFVKEEEQDIVVDTSEDLCIFGKWIAPELNIKVRFAGEEPIDNVTKQYNESMKRILPVYGVAFEEISRKQVDGEPVSASRVREYLKVKDFERIKDMVPGTTCSFLIHKYGDEISDE